MAGEGSVDSALSLLSFDRADVDQLLNRASKLQTTYRECHVCIVMDSWISVVFSAVDQQHDAVKPTCSESKNEVLKAQVQDTAWRLRDITRKRAKARKKFVCSYCLETLDYHDFYGAALNKMRRLIKAGIGLEYGRKDRYCDMVAGPYRQLLMDAVRGKEMAKALTGFDWLDSVQNNFNLFWETTTLKTDCNDLVSNAYKGQSIASKEQEEKEDECLANITENLTISNKSDAVERTTSELSAQACSSQTEDGVTEQQPRLERRDKLGDQLCASSKSVIRAELSRGPDERTKCKDEWTGKLYAKFLTLSPEMTFQAAYEFNLEISYASDLLFIRGCKLFDKLKTKPKAGHSKKKKKAKKTCENDDEILMASKINNAIRCMLQSVINDDLRDLSLIREDDDISPYRMATSFLEFLTLVVKHCDALKVCTACYGAAAIDQVIQEGIAETGADAFLKSHQMYRLEYVCGTLHWITSMMIVRDVFRHVAMDLYSITRCYICSELNQHIIFEEIEIRDSELFGKALKNALEECELLVSGCDM